MTALERSTSWNSTKGTCIALPCSGLACPSLSLPAALPPKVLSLPFSVCVFRLPFCSPRARAHIFCAFGSPSPDAHSPHNTDDAFGLEFGDLLVDTDHSHSLMEVTAMVSADACRRGVWEREGKRSACMRRKDGREQQVMMQPRGM